MTESPLTKSNSQAIKGIAILLMLIHHLFYSVKSFHGMPVEFFSFSVENVVDFARFAKICVPLFVFVTAYGLTIKYNSVIKNTLDIKKMTAKRVVINDDSILVHFYNSSNSL